MRTYHTHQEAYALIVQQQTWLRQIDHMLTPPEQGHSPEAAWEAQWGLWGFVQMLQRQTPVHQAFAQHVATWIGHMGQLLFACFREPRLPRTNNDLERCFRHAKGAYRRMTGRRNWNQYVVRYGRYAIFHEARELPALVLERFRRVPYADFRAERTRWRTSLEPARQYRRFRQHPTAYLQALESAWSSA